jgi:hypothetical protein
MPLPNPDDYTKTVYAIVSPLRWGRIVEAIAQAAELGDLPSARFLLAYFRARLPQVAQLRMTFLDDDTEGNQ